MVSLSIQHLPDIGRDYAEELRDRRLAAFGIHVQERDKRLQTKKTRNMNLFIGILLSILGQALVFFQVQGTVKYQFLQEHKIWVILMGMPITWIFMEATKHLVSWSEGELWPTRLIGFSVGIVVFGILSKVLFGEAISAKTAVCIGLALLIVAVQIFWK